MLVLQLVLHDVGHVGSGMLQDQIISTGMIFDELRYVVNFVIHYDPSGVRVIVLGNLLSRERWHRLVCEITPKPATLGKKLPSDLVKFSWCGDTCDNSQSQPTLFSRPLSLTELCIGYFFSSFLCSLVIERNTKIYINKRIQRKNKDNEVMVGGHGCFSYSRF